MDGNGKWIEKLVDMDDGERRQSFNSHRRYPA